MESIVFMVAGVLYAMGNVRVFGTVRWLSYAEFMTALHIVAPWYNDISKDKIRFIKVFRSLTGNGLAESKEMIEVAAAFWQAHYDVAQKMADDDYQNRRAA